MTDENEHVTVGQLIALLQKLPPETQVWEKTWRSDQLARFNNWLEVYRDGGQLRLYFNTGEASHPESDKYCEPFETPDGFTYEVAMAAHNAGNRVRRPGWPKDMVLISSTFARLERRTEPRNQDHAGVRLLHRLTIADCSATDWEVIDG